MKTMVVAIAALGGILFALLLMASANTALFGEHYPLLLGLNIALAAGLAALIIYQLYRLWQEYRARQFGSRLKLRLMAMFVLMAVLPGALVYAVSVQFVVKSIESWFDLRVDAALEGGMNLGRSALDYLLQDVQAKGRTMAIELSEMPEVRTARLDRLREQAGIGNVTLFSLKGEVLAQASALTNLKSLLPDVPSPALLRRGRSGYAAIEGSGEALILRVLVPVAGFTLNDETRVLQLVQPVPPALARSAESVQAVYRDYQELSLGRQGLQRIYTATLTLTLTLCLFTSVVLAFVLARRLSAPLSILAEGTQAVASGDFTPRQALPARDELGILTQSFNRMTRQLQEARALAEQNRSETEAARAYLESVLNNLSGGVLAFDEEGHLRAANQGALAILRDELEDFEALTIAQWPRFAELRASLLSAFVSADPEWQAQVEMPNSSGATQTLLLRGSRLPAASGGGLVVVFDDITQLIAGQRTAAWAEVAQRLAHEIKNPLTPIQLSAERLQHKLADKLDPQDAAMLGRATDTIVNQVEALKSMVNDFRDYARLPAPQFAPVNLNALVREVLELYSAYRAHIDIELAPDLPPVLGDAKQLRQVIHNLMRNAEDACQEVSEPRIRIATTHAGGAAELELRDNGAGFASHILARAFEPYVTTKSRGTGLGLAIVKKIIDEHQGDIALANGAAGGAVVRIRLPLYGSATKES